MEYPLKIRPLLCFFLRLSYIRTQAALCVVARMIKVGILCVRDRTERISIQVYILLNRQLFSVSQKYQAQAMDQNYMNIMSGLANPVSWFSGTFTPNIPGYL